MRKLSTLYGAHRYERQVEETQLVEVWRHDNDDDDDNADDDDDANNNDVAQDRIIMN